MAGLLTLVTLVPGAWSALTAEKVDIRVVSSRADMVTSGDALVEITGVLNAAPVMTENPNYATFRRRSHVGHGGPLREGQHAI